MFGIPDSHPVQAHKRQFEHKLRPDLKGQLPRVLPAERKRKATPRTSSKPVVPTAIDQGRNGTPGTRTILTPTKRRRTTDVEHVFPVPPDKAQGVMDTLKSMGIKNPGNLVFKWSEKRFHALMNFAEACEDNNLPKKWGNKQLDAFLDALHQKYYIASTLDSQWNTIKKVGYELNKEVCVEHELDFALVKADAKEITDSKLPVSRKLLLQLCQGAATFWTNTIEH